MREVESVALEVLHARVGGDAHVDAGMVAREAGEARDEPERANECVVVTDSAFLPACARSRSVAARIVVSTCAAEA